jgi:hypothetical protein
LSQYILEAPQTDLTGYTTEDGYFSVGEDPTTNNPPEAPSIHPGMVTQQGHWWKGDFHIGSYRVASNGVVVGVLVALVLGYGGYRMWKKQREVGCIFC